MIVIVFKQYQAKRKGRLLSPERGDAFSNATPARSYKDIMKTQELNKEEIEVKRATQKKLAEEGKEGEKVTMVVPVEGRKKRRWDDGNSASAVTPSIGATPIATATLPSSSSISQWDQTPNAYEAGTGGGGGARSKWDETPDLSSSSSSSAVAGKTSAWDATPGTTPGGRKRSRWYDLNIFRSRCLFNNYLHRDETPMAGGETPGATPMGKAAFGMMTPSYLGKNRLFLEIFGNIL